MYGLTEPYQPRRRRPANPNDGDTAGAMILRALRDAPGPLTTNELQERIPRSSRQVQNALLVLRRSGLIVYGRPPSQGRYGWPPGKYRLRPAATRLLNGGRQERNHMDHEGSNQKTDQQQERQAVAKDVRRESQEALKANQDSMEVRA